VWTGERSLETAQASIGERAFAVRRHLFALVLWVAACLGSGELYLRTVSPDFIATVQFVLQPWHVSADGPEQARYIRQFILNGEQADTEVRVIRSKRLLRGVFQALHLATVPELMDGRDGFWSAVRELLRRSTLDAAPLDSEAAAFERFESRVRTRRLATSYVLEIAYRSRDPRLAARVVNSIAAAYLRERIGEAAADTVVTAPRWKDRIASLLKETRTAEDAIGRGEVPANYLPSALPW